MAKKNLQKNPQNTRSVLSPEQKRVRRFREKENRISFRTNEYGYISSDGKKIPDEYLVRITSLQNNVTIVAPFQEDISDSRGAGHRRDHEGSERDRRLLERLAWNQDADPAT